MVPPITGDNLMCFRIFVINHLVLYPRIAQPHQVVEDTAGEYDGLNSMMLLLEGAQETTEPVIMEGTQRLINNSKYQNQYKKPCFLQENT
jgi:protein subunit release factor B